MTEQHFGTDTFGGLLGANINEIENAVCIECGVFFFQEQSALRNRPDAPPFAIRDFKNPGDGFLRGAIPFVLHGAHILIFQLGPAFFELNDEHADGFEEVNRFKSANDDGHAEFPDKILVFSATDNRAHMPRSDEALDAILRMA